MDQQLVLMMTEITGELSPYQVFLLGRVDVAHSNFKFLEQKTKQAKEALARVPRGPGLESVADFYDGLKRDAENEFSMRLAQQQEAERFYRKCRWELIETGVEREFIMETLKALSKGQAVLE